MYISTYYNTKIHFHDILKKAFFIYNNIISYKYVYFKNVDHLSVLISEENQNILLSI